MNRSPMLAKIRREEFRRTWGPLAGLWLLTLAALAALPWLA